VFQVLYSVQWCEKHGGRTQGLPGGDLGSNVGAVTSSRVTRGSRTNLLQGPTADLIEM
jgi:hypothetical protein